LLGILQIGLYRLILWGKLQRLLIIVYATSHLLLLIIGIGQVVIQAHRAFALGEYSLIVINSYLIVSTVISTSCLCKKLLIGRLCLPLVGEKVKDKG